ncbi:MAG TPA: DUF1360 domain-containing protein [Gaiellaceae bacterium]|nr:DUF1360 domain-containing protein [Gaiellaceae bacterium]
MNSATRQRVQQRTYVPNQAELRKPFTLAQRLAPFAHLFVLLRVLDAAGAVHLPDLEATLAEAAAGQPGRAYAASTLCPPRFRAPRREHHPAVQERPPYGSYATLVGSFALGLAVASRFSDPERELTAIDLVSLGLATFKGARTLSHDEVTSFLRQPFVEEQAHEGEGETPAGTGMRQAIGELVTCTRCVGTWVAAGLASTLAVTPRFGRLLVWSLDAAAVNDFLQAGFVALTEKSNELERRAEN